MGRPTASTQGGQFVPTCCSSGLARPGSSCRALHRKPATGANASQMEHSPNSVLWLHAGCVAWRSAGEQEFCRCRLLLLLLPPPSAGHLRRRCLPPALPPSPSPIPHHLSSSSAHRREHTKMSQGAHTHTHVNSGGLCAMQAIRHADTSDRPSRACLPCRFRTPSPCPLLAPLRSSSAASLPKNQALGFTNWHPFFERGDGSTTHTITTGRTINRKLVCCRANSGTHHCLRQPPVRCPTCPTDPPPRPFSLPTSQTHPPEA